MGVGHRPETGGKVTSTSELRNEGQEAVLKAEGTVST